MRASRLLSILILLQLRVRLTAEALAEEFEVSVRTIYRDIDALSAAGIPVYGDRGPGGGFRLLDGYRTRLTGLAADEAEAMLMIGLPGAGRRARARRGGGAGAGQAARRACRPRAATRPGGWRRASTSIRSTGIGPRSRSATCRRIARAVLDQRPVAMRYESWTGVRDWRVEPLGLVLKAGAWYLVARGAGKVRIFRVSNILDQAVEEGGFERPADFDLPAYWSATLRALRGGAAPGPRRAARLAGGAEAAGRARRLCGRGGGSGRTRPMRDGWSRLDLPIETIEQAALTAARHRPEVA